MTTKLISLQEYRTNLSQIWKESQKNKVKYIILVHNKPVLEVTPLFGNTFEEDLIPQLVELSPEEITPEMRKMAKKVKTMNKAEFTNIVNE